MPDDPFTPPEDWHSPDWTVLSYVHEWKRYVNDEVQKLWSTFTDQQKRALAYQANEEAGREDWD